MATLSRQQIHRGQTPDPHPDEARQNAQAIEQTRRPTDALRQAKLEGELAGILVGLEQRMREGDWSPTRVAQELASSIAVRKPVSLSGTLRSWSGPFEMVFTALENLAHEIGEYKFDLQEGLEATPTQCGPANRLVEAQCSSPVPLVILDQGSYRREVPA